MNGAIWPYVVPIYGVTLSQGVYYTREWGESIIMITQKFLGNKSRDTAKKPQ